MNMTTPSRVQTRHEPCPELKTSELCFRSHRYRDGAISETLHEHIPAHRMSRNQHAKRSEPLLNILQVGLRSSFSTRVSTTGLALQLAISPLLAMFHTRRKALFGTQSVPVMAGHGLIRSSILKTFAETLITFLIGITHEKEQNKEDANTIER